jgi:hypothetical protein
MSYVIYVLSVMNVLILFLLYLQMHKDIFYEGELT